MTSMVLEKRRSLDLKVKIQPALRADMPAIAQLHDEVWHEVHRGLAPTQIDGSCEDERSRWSQDERSVQLVAKLGDKIVGFGIAGPARDPLLQANAEIQALCVHPSVRFRGIGTALSTALAQRLAVVFGAQQQAGVWISGLNVAAVAFARALGAVVEQKSVIRHAISNGGLLTSRLQLALVWDHIEELASHATALSHIIT